MEVPGQLLGILIISRPWKRNAADAGGDSFALLSGWTFLRRALVNAQVKYRAATSTLFPRLFPRASPFLYRLVSGSLRTVPSSTESWLVLENKNYDSIFFLRSFLSPITYSSRAARYRDGNSDTFCVLHSGSVNVETCNVNTKGNT